MNSPTPLNPVPSVPPQASKTALPAIGLAGKTLIGGAPVAIVTVYLVQVLGHTTLDPTVASAIGAIGASVVGFAWHIIQAALVKEGIDPNTP